MLAITATVAWSDEYSSPADFPMEALEEVSSEQREARRELEQGLQAVRTGLPILAAEILSPLASSQGLLSPSDQRRANLGLLDALLQADETEQAVALLVRLGNRQDAAFRLRWAIAEFLRGNPVSSQRWLRGVREEDLEQESVPWFYLLKALIADRGEDPTAFADAFQSATEATDSPFLQDTFESIRARLSLLRGEADEETVVALKRQLDSAVAVPLRIRLAREYAVMLTSLGRTEEAVTFLENFVRETDAPASVAANEILLPLAVFQGLSSPGGRESLRRVLEDGTDPESLRVALSLFLGTIDGPAGNETDDLAAIIDARPEHPIRDRLLLAQVELLARDEQFADALERADELLENYPGSRMAPAAKKARAFLSWRQDPPRYRTAATRLLELVPDAPAEEKPYLLQLAGDLFYENGDYSSAAAAYLQAWQDNRSPGNAFQYVNALLGENRFNDAVAWTEENLAGDSSLPDEVLIRIDWNLCSSLIQNGQPERALAIIRRVLERPSLELASKGHFLWLESYALSLLLRNDEALEVVNSLIKTLDTSIKTPESSGQASAAAEPENETGASEVETPSAGESSGETMPDTAGSLSSIENRARNSILSQALLLKGEILLKMDQTEEGTTVMRELRERFPAFRASVLSYLFEARYFAGRDLSGEAQLRLVNLADRFPDSDYAPIALYEAAIIAESRGTPESVSEAIRLLEDLVNRYPNHQIAIHARIKEGEILRSMGDFNSARLVFENTAKRFFTHPLRYLAEIGAAESVLANPDAAREELFEAAALMEKVPTVPDIPESIILESQLKRAEALRRAGEKDSARRTIWQSVEPLLPNRDPDDAALAFWLSKSLLELSVWNSADGRPGEAIRLLELIDILDLPGEDVARAKLRVIESPEQ